MFRKISFLFIFFVLMISACAPAQKTSPTIAPSSTPAPALITESVAATPTKTPSPTETPKSLMIDLTKPFAEWDMSIFTSEQQAMIDRAVNDPDHATVQDKDFYDQVVSEGIAQLTGDPRYAEPFTYDIRQALTEINHYNDDIPPSPEALQVIQEANTRLANFAEYLSAHDIHEISAPLPFSWYLVNISDPDNFPMINSGGGSPVEGYGVNQDTRTGFGSNISGLTTDLMKLWLKGREGVGQNKTRDTAFGEPIFIIYPVSANSVGDLMALINIAGESPEIAQLALI